MKPRSFQARAWLPLLILFLASALTYLPFVGQIGYSNDDWYLMYGAHVQGADYFPPAFERDRPMRAYVLGPAYEMFGDASLPYHLSAYAFRLLGAVSLFWLLNQLWPKTNASLQPAERGSGFSVPNLLITLLFLLYPGFLSQTNPIDYQAQIISLWAVMTSLALTVAAVQAKQTVAKVTYAVLSAALAWIYLGLIEYYIGLEILRLISVYLLVSRNTQTPRKLPSLSLIISTLRAWWPFAIGPVTFLIWRLFFFTSDRNATDVGLQLGALFSSPTTGLWWLARFVQDTLNVIILAWGVPVYHLAFNLRLSQTWAGLGLAGAVALGVMWMFGWAGQAGGEGEAEGDWRGEMLWVGLVSAMAGLIPVILVNRHVEFFSLSRYSLASSVGAAMVAVAMLQYLSAPRLRLALAGVLVGMAVLTHFANGAIAARDAQTMREFWWQVSWRVPDLRDGTTLAAYYPAPLQEDYFLWGAANLIYNPEPQTAQPVDAPISAVLLTPENITRILAGKGVDEPDRRNTRVVMDYGNVLVLTQPEPGRCVRVLDGAQPELSASDDPRIMLVAQASKIANVDANGSHPAVNELAFGPEPAHEWCWYYQQASLARQRGDWEQAAALGDEALQAGFYPSDSVEWFPFLQAYAALGREKDLKKLSSILGADVFLERQACSILTMMAESGALAPDIESSVMEWYCGK